MHHGIWASAIILTVFNEDYI